MQRIGNYIYQNREWSNFYWDTEAILPALSAVRNLQGKLLGKMEVFGFDFQSEALFNTYTEDVLKSSEIEGEHLNPDMVRTSIAQKLGIEYAGTVVADRNVEGVVQMMLDATSNCFDAVTAERLKDWHAALFPTGRSGMFKIVVGEWRKDLKGPMQVVSGTIGKEKIHYEAPPASVLEDEMSDFIEWLNTPTTVDNVIKAAVAHLWFVTIHPFEDGNGRIARAISDLLLARSDDTNQRFYSMSAQIQLERKAYYEMLEKTQKGGLNITAWIMWFLNCLKEALNTSFKTLDKVLLKASFWQKQGSLVFNERQIKMLNKLIDGFDGKLTSSKWAKITKSSKDSAIRDINDLIKKGVLQKEDAGGRSTSYVLV